MPGWARMVMRGVIIFAWPAVLTVRWQADPSWMPQLRDAAGLVVSALAIALVLARRGQHARRVSAERSRITRLERRADYFDARLAGHEGELERHGSWLAAQDEAWRTWRQARGGKPDLRVVSGS